MKSRRLAILSLIVMVLVSTPKAVQQLRRSVAEAQEHAGLAWWNLLLTQRAETGEMAFAQHEPCPQTLAARRTTYADSLASRSSAWPIATARQQKSDTRKVKDRPTMEAPSIVASPELASDNNHAGDKGFTFNFVNPPAVKATDEVAHALAVPEQLASQVAAPQARRSPQAAARILRTFAALDRQPDYAPASVRVVEDLDQSEFAPSPEVMSALLDALGKKGASLQMKVRKMSERNQLPRTRGRLLISRDGNLFHLAPVSNIGSITESE